LYEKVTTSSHSRSFPHYLATALNIQTHHPNGYALWYCENWHVLLREVHAVRGTELPKEEQNCREMEKRACRSQIGHSAVSIALGLLNEIRICCWCSVVGINNTVLIVEGPKECATWRLG
jgi:hypothetical protein